MAIIRMQIVAFDRAFRSINATFRAPADAINRALNRAMAPMKGIGISMTAIFHRSGISLTSDSQNSSTKRNSI